MPVPGPGRVAWDGLQQSIATREPNLEPRRETICFLFRCKAVRIVPKCGTCSEFTEYDWPQARAGALQHSSRPTESDSCHTDLPQLEAFVSTIPIEQHKCLPLTVDQWHPRSISATSAHMVEVPVQELGATDFQTFLNNLRGKLIHAVIHSMVEDMLNRTALVMGSAMLANVLDAPVAKLAMSE